ncbi:MAG: RNA methyltransferase [Candidatus Nitrosopolaris sp.]|jgi:predicted SPOUT superfamily RNA methylase MTH1
MSNPYFPNLWIAIPDSSLSDEQTRRDKTVKVCQFARAFSIFRVKKIYIYHDKTVNSSADLSLLKTVLRYLDTPQYLRKLLYPRTDQLEYAGILHPINAPHHRGLQRIRDVKLGDVRVGVIVKARDGGLHADIGLSNLVSFEGSGFQGKKVNVKIVSTCPSLRGKEAAQYDIKEYWGYEVQEVNNLSKLLESALNTQILITSRKGSYLKDKEPQILAGLKAFRNFLIVFGTPKKGVDEMLALEGRSIDAYKYVHNMFPFQATKTIRLEEAILGSLSILNHILSK